MSLANSLSGPQPEKQSTNIYTVMLIVAFVAIVTATVILAMELNRFGPFPHWQLPAGTSMPSGS